MEFQENRIIYLLDRFDRNEATPSELLELELWYQSFSDAPTYTGQLPDDKQMAERHQLWIGIEAATRLSTGQKDNVQARKIPARRWLPYVAAAILVILMGTWLLINTIVWNPESELRAAGIVPGGNRATLTLTDGRVVELSEKQEGIVIGNDGLRYADGSDVLDAEYRTPGTRQPGIAENLSSENVPLLSISTPRGGTYQVTLPDGSKVWLNAASTLKYPSHFERSERIVELEGEGYFEVSRQGRPTGQGNVPFRVVTKNQVVEVLGTQFNISAYPDETQIKTTLVEGRVKVFVGQSQSPGTALREADGGVLLKPGEQSILSDGKLVVKAADIAVETGWKAGYFNFKGAPIHEVLRQFSRWYDVEIVYAGGIPDLELSGSVLRDTDADKVLNILTFFDLKYRVERESPGALKILVTDKHE